MVSHNMVDEAERLYRGKFHVNSHNISPCNNNNVIKNQPKTSSRTAKKPADESNGKKKNLSPSSSSSFYYSVKEIIACVTIWKT